MEWDDLSDDTDGAPPVCVRKWTIYDSLLWYEHEQGTGETPHACVFTQGGSQCRGQHRERSAVWR